MGWTIRWLPWRSRLVAARADADDARALCEASMEANLAADELVGELERMHRENHLAPKIAEAFRLRPGGYP